MAKSKVILERCFDYRNTPYIRVSCAKGRLTRRDIDAALRGESIYNYKLMYVQNIPEDIPEELCDDGDVWALYEPEDFYDMAVSDSYNKGWEDCMKEYGLD